MVIDNYDDNLQLMPNIQKILESDLPQDVNCEVIVDMRKKHQKLFSRGSKAPNRLNEEKYRSHSACILPFTQMIIRPDGTLAKCCNDPLDDIVLGDLNKQTIREAWCSKVYSELRKAMYFGNRTNISGCDYCDIFGLYNALPSFAKPREHSRLAKEIILRKKFGKVYIFDTNPISKNIYSLLMMTGGGGVDGVINIRNEPQEENINFVTFEQAISEKAFIVFPTPYYEDNLFEFLHANGYQYERDYLIYPPDVW